MYIVEVGIYIWVNTCTTYCVNTFYTVRMYTCIGMRREYS